MSAALGIQHEVITFVRIFFSDFGAFRFKKKMRRLYDLSICNLRYSKIQNFLNAVVVLKVLKSENFGFQIFTVEILDLCRVS